MLWEVDIFAAPGLPDVVGTETVADAADLVLAFWDGTSRGTAHVIDYCGKTGKPCRIIRSAEGSAAP